MLLFNWKRRSTADIYVEASEEVRPDVLGLKVLCACGRNLERGWMVCPYCGAKVA